MAAPEPHFVTGKAGNKTCGTKIAVPITPDGIDPNKTDDNEGNDSINSSVQNLGENSPIIYHYLTFETQLPYPTAIRRNGPPPPPQPDLKAFTSPFLWPKARKDLTIYLSCIATMLTAYTAGAYAPPAAQMAAEWDVSMLAIEVGITTFCIGFSVAPMILAPFSEINGRYPVFVAAGIVFVICQICCAVTQSYAGMLLARFWVGAGSSVFSTMVGGVVSDLYHAEERNTPMALFSGGVLIGTGLGPLVSGFIAHNVDWRWVFWLQVITCGLTVAAVAFFFKETRGSVLLSRKAARLNRWCEERERCGHAGFDIVESEGGKRESQRIRWIVKSDEERGSIRKMIEISVYRPFHLLVTEPVVFFFSLWVAFAWGVLYLTFGSIPLVFRVSHNFNIQQSFSVFAAMSVSAILSTAISIYQEYFLAAFLTRTTSTSKIITILRTPSPEGRLYFACVESTLLPLGLFWFGWTQFGSIPWIIPALAVGSATMGVYSVYLATFNYLADAYHRYASSALAAQSFCRNMLGGVFPLVSSVAFNRLTFAGASSLLGGIAALLTIVPWVLVLYGPRIRARSKFAMNLA